MDNNKPRILLVDDNIINIKVTSLLLSEQGYSDICIAQSGQQALDLFLDGFDVILLDIGLPDICGLDVCRAMRNQLHGKSLPIIVVTAHGEQIKQNCLDAGANDFITKPVDIRGLITLINRWVIKK
jgi:CheY-like chemotaxis protein